MPVETVQDPGQVFEAIDSGNKTIVHYWAPWMGPESPFMPIFWEANEDRGEEINFLVVDSGFVHPQHSPDEMPLTVLYNGGEEVDTAPLDPDEIQGLIERA
ncbi:hypothetical protein ASPWEDRAFT_33442 [Aspergillus wentii DTO 134E9]|uniref:Thioredoxin domain-containing protein n=1 Tax=Aspergillus wentii DTO 134E9 TaxID=1073089 RepID=A0A1L9RYV0_ASPWE|nr:uncharacterized protein ASPWEDRAFT_33442 [Aspergillus wentii DTO 134E9]KAI9932544.1 hypothetical protein MW887_008786 [Aspergillus wentii]OJJ40109.1 hypothetical protein ASPWEDRAFT_33442 [Aspergillus wentii DTO 134E9]